MVKTASLLVYFVLTAGISMAQKINFKVLNVSTGLPEARVKVSSLPEHLFITYSNDKGEFSTFILQDDTLELSHENFHPLILQIKVSNFDSSHTVVVGIVPNSKDGKPFEGSHGNLQNFEYHFVHDTLGENSHMKINMLENVHAVRQRTNPDDKSFKVGAVNIDKQPSGDGKNHSGSHYKLIDK